MAKKKDPKDLVEVELLQPHTHQGVLHKPGEKIKLRPDQAAWLKKQKVAKPAS